MNYIFTNNGGLDPRDPMTKLIRFIIWCLLVFCVVLIFGFPVLIIWLCFFA